MMTSAPVAPKDAASHRRGIYIMANQKIQSMKRQSLEYSSEIYLNDNRLINKVEIIGGVTDKIFLESLGTASGFYQKIAAIGVCVLSKEEDSIRFRLKNYGKENRYLGHQLEMDVPTTGVEMLLELEAEEGFGSDSVVGQMEFLFSKENITASVTVKLYLKDSVEDIKIPEISMEKEIDFSSQEIHNLCKKSMIQMGNSYRFQKMFEKAKRGEEITIAFIGGSITQGAGAVPIQEYCYANQTYEMLCELLEIPTSKCHFIKAGIGGTSSELGLLRYDLHVLDESSYQPDLVIVEFAVNDEGDETNGICHESLIYHILKSENEPAVLMLFSVFANDWNLQERLIPIGKAYQLPMVSMRNAMVEQFALYEDNGQIIPKRQYFYDIYHPTNVGHTMMAKCVLYTLLSLKNEDIVQDIDLDIPPAIGREFADITYFDKKILAIFQANMDEKKEVVRGSKYLNQAKIRITEGDFCETDLALQCVERDKNAFQTPQFANNWQYNGIKNGESFRMSIYCKSLFLLVKDSDAQNFGKIDIFMDGKKINTYDARDIGWTHANAKLLFAESRPMEHFVEIKMAPFEEEKAFTILGFGFCI